MSTSKQKIKRQRRLDEELCERIAALKKIYLASVIRELDDHRGSISSRTTKADVTKNIQFAEDDLKPILKTIDEKFVVLT
ncbi:MAG: hypothetical protein EON60_12200 [Alphaproteobacteria bacterium]|nr:MAG: hypothetical protein EON60_12200 [Alphaproteobacteria bacterium]